MQYIYKILYSLFLITTIAFTFFLQHQSQSCSDQFAETQSATIEYLEGQIIDIENNLFTIIEKNGEKVFFDADPDFLFNPYQKGDIVTLYKMNQEGEIIYDIVDYVHLDGIFFCFICFLLITIWIAKHKGFFSIISLLVSTSLFYFVFLQGIQAGYSPFLACLLFVISISFLTIPLIHGFNRKSASSLIAINVGFVMSFLISLFFKNLVKLGNVPSEALRNLTFQLPELNMSEIILVVLFMGAVGALIDVAVTISSAIFEAAENRKIDFSKSFKLGMEVGKDILGSMINTLLLAYLASSIPFFILITQAQKTSLGDLINYDFVAMEVTRTLIGAMSLVLLVPLSAVIASWMLSRK